MNKDFQHPRRQNIKNLTFEEEEGTIMRHCIHTHQIHLLLKNQRQADTSKGYCTNTQVNLFLQNQRQAHEQKKDEY